MVETRVKIATCHTCHFPIYQGDLIHHSSTGSHSGTIDTYGVEQKTRGGTTFYGSSGDYSGTSHGEQWVQCQWCLNEYGKELVKQKAWKWRWGLRIWLGITIACLVVGIAYCALQTGNEVSILKKLQVGVGSGLFGGLILSFIVWWIVRYFFEPVANRYKFRSYRKK